MLPFFSSAIVPAEAMGTGIRQFAEYQPSPRSSIGARVSRRQPDPGQTVSAVAWSVGVILISYLWALRTFERRA